MEEAGVAGAVSEPRFFRTQAEWRQWLEKNHLTATEQVIGFHKAASGRKGIARKEALDEALCFGWIDGVTRRIDEHSWQMRYYAAAEAERVERHQPPADRGTEGRGQGRAGRARRP